MEKTTITKNNIHIEDSYKTSSKYKMGIVLTQLRKEYPDNEVLLHRTNDSIIAEWLVHTYLYNWGLFKSHTKDVDINYPLRWFEKIAYKIVEWFI